MQKESSKIKYFLYARKSSESEDRQIQSIDDQVNRLTLFAKQYSLDIAEVITESKSAKKPNNRPLFENMLKKIEKGEADGILCWQINRLSRNPKDSGDLQWMLQQRQIKSIQTMDKEYLPEDNALLFSVETGVANQFILDLSKNVKRGIQEKLNRGWRPGNAPTAYLNDLATHTLIPDPKRFKLIRKAWDLMLTGNYTVPQILDKLNNNWGFRTVKKKRLGNRPMAMSGLYKIFTNLFYAGVIVHKGEKYPGKHKPMITLEEYDHVQLILGRKGKPRPQKHEFPFTGMIKCGECGCLNTAEIKKKIIKTTGEFKKYTYYHCTRKKKHIKCSQKKVVSQENIESQIKEFLDDITIMPEFKDWALDVIRENDSDKIKEKEELSVKFKKDLDKKNEELSELTRMRYKNLIDDEFFLREKETLENELIKIEERNKQLEKESQGFAELTEKTFNFSAYAKIKFENGTNEDKKEIFAGLGSNSTIKDKKLFIEANEWLVCIKNGYKPLASEYVRFELDKKPLDKVKSERLSSLITRWHGM